MDAPQGRKLFVFDRVFGEDINQEGVWEYLNDSVSSFLQGYNVSILAYGQSGAGKSYTMGTSGPSEQNDTTNMGECPYRIKDDRRVEELTIGSGIVPRASQLLFEKLGEGSGQTHNRTSSSGLRTPTRYSTTGGTFGKGLGKDWEMKATYVEVRDRKSPGFSDSSNISCRFIMNILGIFWCQTPLGPMSGAL